MSENDSIVHNKSHILEMLIDSTKTSYAILDVNGNILEVNNHMIDMIGCDKNLVGRSTKDLIDESQYEKFNNAINDILAGKIIKNLELKLNYNKVFHTNTSWVTITAGLMENGTRRIFCIVTDISMSKNEEIKKYIDEQKKKDKIRQTILGIRKPLQKELKY